MRFGAKSWLLTLGLFAFVGLIVQISILRRNGGSAGMWSVIQPDVTLLPPQVKAQKANERVWKKVELNRIFSLAKWGTAYVDEQANIYICDYDFKINKFSSDGKFLVQYGKGKGSGPGEFLTPSGFAVDRELNVWVCDASTGLVTVFGRDGLLKTTIRSKSTPYKVCPIGGGEFVVQKPFAPDHLFEMYDINGNLEREFGANIMPEQSKFPILLDGSMATDGNFLYYAFHYFGYIVCFDLKDGKIKYFVKTIDQLPTPKVEVLRGAMRISKDNRIASVDLSFQDGRILVKSGIRLKGEREKSPYTVIDTYLASDGSYLFSCKFPDSGFFSGNFYYQTSDTLLSKWAVSSLSN